MRKIEGNITKNQIEAEELMQYIGEVVQIHGSIYKVRKMKGFSFVLLRTSRDVIQCVAADDIIAIPQEEKLLHELIYKETGSEFVFVTHYPSKKRPFYAMECAENLEETESFDLLFRGRI